MRHLDGRCEPQSMGEVLTDSDCPRCNPKRKTPFFSAIIRQPSGEGIAMLRIALPEDEEGTPMLNVPLWPADLRRIAREAIACMEPD